MDRRQQLNREVDFYRREDALGQDTTVTSTGSLIIALRLRTIDIPAQGLQETQHADGTLQEAARTVAQPSSPPAAGTDCTHALERPPSGTSIHSHTISQHRTDHGRPTDINVCQDHGGRRNHNPDIPKGLAWSIWNPDHLCWAVSVARCLTNCLHRQELDKLHKASTAGQDLATILSSAAQLLLHPSKQNIARWVQRATVASSITVSYTHLTLPTIYSV